MEVVIAHNAGKEAFPNSSGGEFEAPSIKDSHSPVTFLASIGVHECFSADMWRAAVTELVATTCLLFTLTTTIIACLESHESDPKFLVPVSIFVCAFLLLMVTVPLSGGHMNPIFTFIAALKGVITWARALSYLLAQCLGSLITCLILKGSMDNSRVEKYSLGGCLIDGNGSGISPGAALVIESSCTFLVLYVAVTVAYDKGRCEELGLTVVCVMVAGVYALAVFISITVTERAGYGGVGLNPARCLGPALLLGGSLWDGHWVFWIGPFSACLLYHLFSLTLPS